MNKYKINIEKIVNSTFIITSTILIILLIIYSIRDDSFNINNVNINNNEFLYYSLITIILVYVIKTLFLIFVDIKTFFRHQNIS